MTKTLLQEVALFLCPKANSQIISALAHEKVTLHLTTPLRICHFAAQVAHESGFISQVENLSYSKEALLRTWPNRFTPETAEQYARQPERIANKVYAGRMGNGDEASGDGWRFIGRGLLQLTGRENYQNFSTYYQQYYKTCSIVEHPQSLLHPENAVLSALWFWNMKKCYFYADQDDLRTITRLINGGYHGLVSREAFLRRAKQFAALSS